MRKSTHTNGTSSGAAEFVAEVGRTGLVAALLNRLSNWRRRRQLTRLDELDDHMLEDIGITRLDLLWARGLPLSRNPLLELDDLARDRTRARRTARIRPLPGTRAPVVRLTPSGTPCG